MVSITAFSVPKACECFGAAFVRLAATPYAATISEIPATRATVPKSQDHLRLLVIAPPSATQTPGFCVSCRGERGSSQTRDVLTRFLLATRSVQKRTILRRIALRSGGSD